MPEKAPLTSYAATVTLPTRWNDNDVYGHVNNVVYYAFFDTAVNSWLISKGVLDIHDGDTIGLVVETGCKYYAPLAFPEEITAGLSVRKLGQTSVIYDIGLFKAGESTPAAEGFFVHVYVDKDTRKPVDLPANMRAALSGLLIKG